MSDHPIRLVVTDDLVRSRLTVFFRLLLAIPHVLWLGLWATITLVVVVINWFAALFTGRSPQGLHDYLAGFVRYGLHVTAYLFLAANPYPKFFLGSTLPPYPVDVEIDPPQGQRRLVTLFRLVLGIPAALLMATLSGGGGGSSSQGVSLGIAPAVSVLTWFAALARGRAPWGIRDLTAWCLGYTAQFYAYLFLLTDRYPFSGPTAHLAGLEPPTVDERVPGLENTDDLRRSRLTVLFRLPLAFPHLVWWLGWTLLAVLAWLVNWIATLVIGRSPRPFARFLAAFIRYSVHLYAFLYVIGNPFPGFVGKQGSYPVDVRIEPFASQSRWITLFRPLLALPVLLISGALAGVTALVALFGWFASLAKGRMPAGLQDAGAYTLGYGAQVQAYAFFLTDRYPHSSPLAALRPPGAATVSGQTLDCAAPGAFV